MTERTDAELVDLAREIKFAAPRRDQIEEMRTAVLASMPLRPASRRGHRPWLIVAGLAAAASAAVVVEVRTPDRWDSPPAPVVAPTPPTPPPTTPTTPLAPIAPDAPTATPALVSTDAAVERPRAKREVETAEHAFRAAWDALHSGDAAIAASGFDKVIALAPGGGLVEDAEFWRAAALARTGRADAAEAAYATFLRDFPHSVRTGEAEVLVGWMRIDAHDVAGAELHFRTALDDSSEHVRASARAGLAEIARRHPSP